jgi:hypothetical protein
MRQRIGGREKNAGGRRKESVLSGIPPLSA